MVVPPNESPERRIDTHVHLAGSGCCDSGCWLGANFRKRYTFKLLKLINGISDHQLAHTIDQDWGLAIAELVRNSSLDQAVVLGFDGVYDAISGELDLGQSQMIIPAEWVFELCHRYPELLPGPSINPFRKDAMDVLDYCIDEGAVLIKWLPAAQGIDPSVPSIKRFYQRCAEAKLPLLIHMGAEKTFATVNHHVNDVELLRYPLDCGVKVICAHSATRIIGTNEPDHLPGLKQLLTSYNNLWVDNSGLCNPSRFSHVPKLAQDLQIASRTLYGSDWPVPSNAFYYAGKMPWQTIWRLERLNNRLDRDIEIKRFFGYLDKTLTRSSQVLANLERWPLPHSTSQNEKRPRSLIATEAKF